MIRVGKEEFLAFISRHPLAIPDGFKLVGAYQQTKWIENGLEVARQSLDGFGTIYEVDFLPTP